VSLRIVIDVRRINDFGIGTYIRNLVQALAAIDLHNHYTLVISPADLQELPRLARNFEVARMADRTLMQPITSHFPSFCASFRRTCTTYPRIAYRC
jgi:hypothetical protein